VNCYSTGLVTATNVPDHLIEYLGGFSGGGDVPSSCYWDTETSGQGASAGNATGKTTAEMQTLATFADWDIATPATYTGEVWYIVPGEDYPRLAWEGLPILPPVAAFTASPTTGTAPLTVSFTDESTGATLWAWEFGDGRGSGAQNPTYTYATPGTYTVTLTATNAGGSDAETKAGYITVTAAPTPTTATPTVTPAPTPPSSSAHSLPYSEQRKDTMGFLLMCWGALPFVGVFCIVIFLVMNGAQRGSGGI
jgi:PKD repeat protein